MSKAQSFQTASIQRLLRPSSVAIVGASANPGALGASVLANLERAGYSGEIHLINPKRDEINGRPCLKSIDDLPEGVDCAVLAIPRVAVLDSVRACAKRGVGGVVIFSAGFAEGGEDGLAEQLEIARIAQEHGMVVEGPNCLGFVNYVDSIALTFVQTPPRPLEGRPGIAVVSQSGAMAAVLATSITARDLNISFTVSTGNEAASGVEDYVEYMLDDPNTKAITM
ncbi:MAG: CoA-binding protein, partial [Candidatus Thiodiazotropha sp.]